MQSASVRVGGNERTMKYYYWTAQAYSQMLNLYNDEIKPEIFDQISWTPSKGLI